MRIIQNTSLQGHRVPFATPTGPFEIFFRPKRAIMVPDSYTSKILENLIHRRILRVIKNTPTVTVTPENKYTRKSK
jgi:hypothetical protein